MNQLDTLWEKLSNNGFKISTDTRKDVKNSIFFALKGENFDGNTFVETALEKGAAGVVTEDALEILQKLARKYRNTFNIPIIAIGGSNGKTTTRELIRHALKTRYKVYATEENLNNHIGVPLSIFSMDKEAEIAVFEIGANHPGEHTELLEILNPTHVLVTNDGLDHLEGFGSPAGVRDANNEIITWAHEHGATVFDKKEHGFRITASMPLTIGFQGNEYPTNLIGDYNLENINWAITVGTHFGIDLPQALIALKDYVPKSKRSQLLLKGSNRFIIDCYNANPTSMRLSLESFAKTIERPRGIILGDMLELGSYTEAEHKKIVDYLVGQELDVIILIGDNFKDASRSLSLKSERFVNVESAKLWFQKQGFKTHTFLLKGSRGMKLEKVVEE